jgi:hypothetical protein
VSFINGLRSVEKAILRSHQVKHICKNYSMTEVGFRHNHQSLGMMVRDQGYIDLYSDDSRFLVTKNVILSMGGQTSLATRKIQLNPDTLENLLILGKHINPKVFDGIKLLALSALAGDLRVLGPDAVDSQGGPLVNGFVPLSAAFEEHQVFLQSPESHMNATGLKFHFLERSMRGIEVTQGIPIS